MPDANCLKPPQKRQCQGIKNNDGNLSRGCSWVGFLEFHLHMHHLKMQQPAFRIIVCLEAQKYEKRANRAIFSSLKHGMT